MNRKYKKNDLLDFGKYKGTPIYLIPESYLEWCSKNIEDFEILDYSFNGTYMSSDKAYNLMSTIEYDSETGTRTGYTKFNSNELVPVTYHDDGGMTIHCGGPCGDLYLDYNGDS
jgi:hypothetical protein